jgi:hypothetical protein
MNLFRGLSTGDGQGPGDLGIGVERDHDAVLLGVGIDAGLLEGTVAVAVLAVGGAVTGLVPTAGAGSLALARWFAASTFAANGLLISADAAAWVSILEGPFGSLEAMGALCFSCFLALIDAGCFSLVPSGLPVALIRGLSRLLVRDFLGLVGVVIIGDGTRIDRAVGMHAMDAVEGVPAGGAAFGIHFIAAAGGTIRMVLGRVGGTTTHRHACFIALLRGQHNTGFLEIVV